MRELYTVAAIWWSALPATKQLLCFASGPPNYSVRRWLYRYVLWGRVYTMQVGSPESTRMDARAAVSWKSYDVNAAARIKKNSLGKFDRLKF
jgi:hypothetical protein